MGDLTSIVQQIQSLGYWVRMEADDRALAIRAFHPTSGKIFTASAGVDNDHEAMCALAELVGVAPVGA